MDAITSIILAVVILLIVIYGAQWVDDRCAAWLAKRRAERARKSALYSLDRMSRRRPF